MKRVIGILLAGVLAPQFLIGCAGTPPPAPVVWVEPPIPVRSVARAEQGWRMVDQGAVLIDVRDREVFAHSHIGGSTNIPLPELVAGHKRFAVAKEKLIVVYGTRASRAGVTAALLTRHGYANAHDAGSFDDMVDVRPWSKHVDAHLVQQNRTLSLADH